MSQQAHRGTLASQTHVLCNNVRSSKEAKGEQSNIHFSIQLEAARQRKASLWVSHLPVRHIAKLPEQRHKNIVHRRSEKG